MAGFYLLGIFVTPYLALDELFHTWNFKWGGTLSLYIMFGAVRFKMTTIRYELQKLSNDLTIKVHSDSSQIAIKTKKELRQKDVNPSARNIIPNQTSAAPVFSA